MAIYIVRTHVVHIDETWLLIKMDSQSHIDQPTFGRVAQPG